MNPMRELLAKYVRGRITRRQLARRLAGMGFGAITIESILDTAAAAPEQFRVEPFSEKTPYEQWMATEGVPVHRGYHVADLRALELKPWARLGARGALVDLDGAEGVDGAYVCEIAPGASTTPQRFLFEEEIGRASCRERV